MLRKYAIFLSLTTHPRKRFSGILPALNPDTARRWGQIETMKPHPGKQFGRLEILCSAATLCLVIGSVLGLWPFNLAIALVLLAVLYGILRDLRSLNRSKHPVTAHYGSRQAYAEQTDRTSR